jgi:hypothetical protein
MVYGDEPDVVVVADPTERAHEVTRLNAPSGACSEYEVGVWPRGADVSSVAGLARRPTFKCLPGKSQERQVSLSSASLDRAEKQLAADALKLLAYTDASGVEVDVGPAEAEDFAAPQAVEDQQYECCVQRARLRRRQDARLPCKASAIPGVAKIGAATSGIAASSAATATVPFPACTFW